MKEPTCKGCGRTWPPVRKSGYCSECEDAMEEDRDDGRREERKMDIENGAKHIKTEVTL